MVCDDSLSVFFCFFFFLFFFFVVVVIFSFNNYIRLRYFQLRLVNRVATFRERITDSACRLFLLRQFNCICLSFTLMLRIKCGYSCISSYVHLIT